MPSIEPLMELHELHALPALTDTLISPACVPGIGQISTKQECQQLISVLIQAFPVGSWCEATCKAFTLCSCNQQSDSGRSASSFVDPMLAFAFVHLLEKYALIIRLHVLTSAAIVPYIDRMPTLSISELVFKLVLDSMYFIS